MRKVKPLFLGLVVLYLAACDDISRDYQDRQCY
jgi:hypothetical protein